jgi:predicted phosphodiesterase
MAQETALPNKPDSVKFGVIGDMGTGGTSQHETAKTLTSVRQGFPFSFVITLGDNIYGSRDYVSKFERPYQALLAAKVQFYASLGNHDDQNERFYKNYNMDGKRYYTFEKGNVKFFVLDSTLMDKLQLDWIDQALEASGSEWKIAYFHHPLYSTGRAHGPSLDLRSALEPLFVKHGVDVVFNGHEHFYQRIKPQKGIHYFISGAAGQLRNGDIRRQEPMAAGFDQDRSFMLVEVAGKELYFQAVSRAGKVVDSGMIPNAADPRRATSLTPSPVATPR